MDHIEPFNHHHPSSGGKTTVINLRPGCRHHHLLKTHTDWNYHRNPDRSTTFTSPTGHAYIDPPEAITLPGEWLRNISDIARTAPSPTNGEHARTCQSQGTGEPPAMSVSDHVRAYLQSEKRNSNHANAITKTRAGAAPRAGAHTPTHEPEEPPPF